MNDTADIVTFLAVCAVLFVGFAIAGLALNSIGKRAQ